MSLGDVANLNFITQWCSQLCHILVSVLSLVFLLKLVLNGA